MEVRKSWFEAELEMLDVQELVQLFPVRRMIEGLGPATGHHTACLVLEACRSRLSGSRRYLVVGDQGIPLRWGLC